MAKRHYDALYIQMGAINPSGICHSIMQACQEVRDEAGDVRNDPAVRLMVHQLAFICRVAEFDEAVNSAYRDCTEKCKQNVSKDTLKVLGL